MQNRWRFFNAKGGNLIVPRHVSADAWAVAPKMGKAVMRLLRWVLSIAHPIAQDSLRQLAGGCGSRQAGVDRSCQHRECMCNST